MVVPPRNHKGSDLRRTCVVCRKVRDPRTPGFRLCNTRRRRRQAGLRRKAHPEPLPSFADRKAPRAFHQNPAGRPGLFLHYHCRDYAPLQSRPACLAPSDRGWKPFPQRSSSQSVQLGEKDGHIRGRSRWFVDNAGYELPPSLETWPVCTWAPSPYLERGEGEEGEDTGDNPKADHHLGLGKSAVL